MGVVKGRKGGHGGIAVFAAWMALACGGGDGGGATPPACVVQGVSVAPASASIQVGQGVALTAGVTQQNCGTVAVAWSTSAPAVASVSATGQVTGVAVGTSTVTASAGGRSADAAITVLPRPLFSITVSPSAPSVEVGATLALSAAPRDSVGNPVSATITWASSDVTVATVNPAGVLTGVKVGTATITASSGTKSGTVQATVTVPGVASIALTPGARSLDAGTTLLVQAQPRDRTGAPVNRTVTWGVSNATVARVSATAGNVVSVEFVASGNATVTATADGVSASVDVNAQARRPRFAYAYVFDTLAALPPFAYDTSDFTYSSAAGQVVVQRRGPGQWRVLFPGLRLSIASEPMLPVVRPLGTASGDCVVDSRYTGPFNATVGDVFGVDVDCAAADGTPQGRPFLVALFGSNYTTIPWAFAEVTDPVAATTGNVYLPGGGTAVASRTAGDVYRVQLTPLPTGFDAWHALSVSAGLACASVATAGSGANRGADLDCVTGLGARARARNALFVLLNGRDQFPHGDGVVSAAGVVTPSSGGTTPAVLKPGTGVYNVRVSPPGLSTTRYPAFVVSAFRSAANPTVACRVAALSTPVPGSPQARVECRDALGTLRDNAFSFSAVY